MTELVNSLFFDTFKEDTFIGCIAVEFGFKPMERDQGDFARTLCFSKHEVQLGNKQVD